MSYPKPAIAFSEEVDRLYPALPDGMERESFIRLFQSVAKPLFGLTDAEILSFTMMAQDTRPSDWKRGDVEPCCWRQQLEVANRCQKSRHTLRRHEAKLGAIGLIGKRVMAHGGRSGFVGCGIFFSPAIALVPAMLVFRAALDQRAAEHRLLCNLRSVHKGHFRSALAALSALEPNHPDLGARAEPFDAWPDARTLRQSGIEVLRDHVEDADRQTQELLRALEKTENLHHRGSMDAAPYIQDTTHDSSFVCNAEPDISPNCEEQNEFHLKLGGAKIFELCSDDMQMYLSARMDDRIGPTAHDLDCAVQAMLPELGISNSAWSDACQTMGRDLAAMCVIITDVNRDHPQIRVRNPGGYLRGMTNAHRTGHLNIMGSLIALSERRAAARNTGPT